MASSWPNDSDSVLRGLFGSLVSSAQQKLSTSDVWSQLRSAASDWARSVLTVTVGSDVSDAQVAAEAQKLIGHVGAADVSRYRGIAGQMVRAQQNLRNLDPSLQVTGEAIFTPPWSIAAGNPAAPTRYRLRVLRDITVKGFTEIQRQEWATYDLGMNLTSLDAALKLANDAFNRSEYNKTASINAVLDYQIEVA